MVARALGTIVVTTRGSLDLTAARVLKSVLYDLIEDQGNLAVVVDVDGLTAVDPGCLDIFVAAHGWAISRGGQLTLGGAQDELASLLEAAGVAQLVKISPDRIVALPASAS